MERVVDCSEVEWKGREEDGVLVAALCLQMIAAWTGLPQGGVACERRWAIECEVAVLRQVM